jgi:hypothetical protein
MKALEFDMHMRADFFGVNLEGALMDMNAERMSWLTEFPKPRDLNPKKGHERTPRSS